jgi:DNA-binding transcriptional LysR family regulator
MLLLSPHSLNAFAEVVRLASFSKAAKALRITQPALSMRIKQLESETGHVLLIRSRGGARLTPSGERLIEYVRLREIVDNELQSNFSGGAESSKISGQIRLAGHFSVIANLGLKVLAPLQREHEGVQLFTMVREHHETSLLLKQGKCDLALVMEPLSDETFETHFLGYEKYVLIKSKKFTGRVNTFIDSHPLDRTTEEFFKVQNVRKKSSNYSRSFLHNEVGILRGVELGLGRAVVAAREVTRSSLVTCVSGYKPLFMPCYLQASRNARRSKMLSLAIDEIKKNAPKMLDATLRRLP